MDDHDPLLDRPRWSVGAVVGTYLVVGLVWIVTSTAVVEDVGRRTGLAAPTIEQFKGVGFVVVTAAVLFASMRKWERAYGAATAERQRALALREQRFRNLAEHSQGAVYRFRFTPRPELVYMSPQFEEMTGFSAQDLRDEPDLLVSRVHPDDRHRLAFLAMDDPTRGPTAPAVTSVRFQCADDEWIWIEDHHTPEVDDRGRVVADQGVAFDVTARRREEEARREALEHERAASERLRRSVEAHRTFLTSISHELRTPLTGIVGFAQTLQSHDGDLDENHRMQLLARLTASTRRLHRLLDDLLDLDRLDRGVLQLRLHEHVDLAVLTAVVVGELDAPAHSVRLDVPSTDLRLDRPKVERIVDNLLRNAVRHTPAGCTVWVRGHEQDGHVHLVVEDDGPGLDGDAETLFQPFRQGSTATTSASPGIGVGLALVREFARIHGGTAWYEQRTPHGSRFCVRLPVSA